MEKNTFNANQYFFRMKIHIVLSLNLTPLTHYKTLKIRKKGKDICSKKFDPSHRKSVPDEK